MFLNGDIKMGFVGLEGRVLCCGVEVSYSRGVGFCLGYRVSRSLETGSRRECRVAEF